VVAFARACGEVASLSAVDVKVIALAHTLETAAHGQAHLRAMPPSARVQSRGTAAAVGKLPGWGEEGAEWDALDQDVEDRELQQSMHIIPLLILVAVMLPEPLVMSGKLKKLVMSLEQTSLWSESLSWRRIFTLGHGGTCRCKQDE
jgi:hypothetical protein